MPNAHYDIELFARNIRKYKNLIWVFIFLKLNKLTIEKIINNISNKGNKSKSWMEKWNEFRSIKVIYNKKTLLIIKRNI